MGLVNELQESAERDDVLTVLRKAKRVSSKLSLPDISTWLDHEQNGYPDQKTVPAYREIAASYCYNTNGYIPAGYGLLKSGIIPLDGFGNITLPVVVSISTVSSWIAKLQGGDKLYVSAPNETAAWLRRSLSCSWPEILDQITFMVQLNSSHVQDIPEQVKNKVLDWTCSLESAGVTGEGHSFSNQERQTAQSVVFNITNSKIDQLNSAGANIKRSDGTV